ncbi:hypothetical protein AVEN_247240-1 [Araneus ventricosus]|uniref:Uncharacterized protein n=1 Tax=Araneus ventricosus TaxID=182803 RepID=A0A4Y2EUG3_ARAVE|nr:hypothetical protein AVEN_247240-1 [Araneus ventricosus]
MAPFQVRHAALVFQGHFDSQKTPRYPFIMRLIVSLHQVRLFAAIDATDRLRCIAMENLWELTGWRKGSKISYCWDFEEETENYFPFFTDDTATSNGVTLGLPRHTGLLNDSPCNRSSTEAAALIANRLATPDPSRRRYVPVG